MRQQVEAWLGTLGRIVGLGLIILNGILYVSRGTVEPTLLVLAGGLFGLGDIIRIGSREKPPDPT